MPGETMDEDPHWVTKAEAMRALDVSLSTLDRMIRKGEVEVRREGRLVYVRMLGREYLSDAELLRRARARLDESQQEALRLKRTVSALERERDEARDGYGKREDTWLKETAAHDRIRRVAFVLGLIAVVLLGLLIISVFVLD